MWHTTPPRPIWKYIFVSINQSTCQKWNEKVLMIVVVVAVITKTTLMPSHTPQKLPLYFKHTLTTHRTNITQSVFINSQCCLHRNRDSYHWYYVSTVIIFTLRILIVISVIVVLPRSMFIHYTTLLLDYSLSISSCWTELNCSNYYYYCINASS